MNVGDSVIIEFHSFGFSVSHTHTILSLTDTSIFVDDYITKKDGTQIPRQFCLKTGNCLNDNRSDWGARWLKLK